MSQSEEFTITKSIIQRLDNFMKHAPNGAPYWEARNLQELLGYAQWYNFELAIDRAKTACLSVGTEIRYHFFDTKKVMASGRWGKQTVKDVVLSRLACYLIAMNGDSTKPEIAAAQHYFAYQTRRQEITDQQDRLEQRIELRDQVKESVKELNKVAQKSGVQNYGLFADAGLRGLYGEIGLRQIKAKKGIHEKEQLFDCIGSQELAANYFKNTQAEAKLERDRVKGEQQAITVHHDTAKTVRDTIKNLGGIMPEELPSRPSLKQLAKATKQTKKLPPSSNPSP